MDTTREREKAILVGLALSSRERGEASEYLFELRELARSAGAEVVEVFLQEKAHPDPAYLIGEGKLREIRDAVTSFDANFVVFDEELSPGQVRNLERVLEVKVLDRSELILDIFAQRARSREGQLQVELAQLQYLLPRLTGKGALLSRLGGGIGTRGPGETKLEVDRRRVRSRISKMKAALDKLEGRRELHRRKRRSIPLPTISLIGYTNAGKSTLFSRLAGEPTFISEKMFATLDPLIRRVELPSGQEALVGDTVGFIRKLPHSLIAAFHATLEEALAADLLLHVIDASHGNFHSLARAVYEVLDEIGVADIPILEVYNKTDLVQGPLLVETSYPHVEISALSGHGLEVLLKKTEDLLTRDFQDVVMKIPFEDGELVSLLQDRGRVEQMDFQEDGVELRASLRRSDVVRYSKYLVGERRGSGGR